MQAAPYVAVDSSQVSGMCTRGTGACTVGTEDQGPVEEVQRDWHLDEVVGAVAEAEVKAAACAVEIVKADVDTETSHKEVHIRNGEAPNICHR